MPAPTGNHNALKHGFYSRKFKSREQADLDQVKTVALADEISLLRVFIRRVCEVNLASDDPAVLLDTLRTISFALTTLNRLVRTQLLIVPPEKGKYEAMIEQLAIDIGREIDEGTFYSHRDQLIGG